MGRRLLPLILLLLASCADQQPPACPGWRGQVFSLYFGLAIEDRANVTPAEWADFVDRTVVPNLPDGFTVLDGTGAWMNPVTRKTSRENSKVLVAAMPGTPDSRDAIQRVRKAYEDRFHQLKVGLTIQPVGADF